MPVLLLWLFRECGIQLADCALKTNNGFLLFFQYIQRVQQ